MNEIEKQALLNIKLLMKDDDGTNVPKVITRKGMYTKKFLAYNRKLVREGKTFYYADKTKYFDPVKQTFKKRSGKTGLKLNLSVSMPVLDSYTNVSYRAKTIMNIKTLNSDNQVTITVDLKKLNFTELIKLIKEHAGGTRLMSSSVNSNKIVALNDTNLKELSNINELTYQENGSDMEYIQDIIKNDGVITISNVVLDFINDNEGEFFKYFNMTHYDFSRYDIRHEGAMKYSKNCLLIALENGGLSTEKCNRFKCITKNGIIPTCKLPQICKELDICIDIRKLITNRDNTNHKQMVYGDKTKEKFKIGLIDNHYFIYEKTNNTRYSLTHYNALKDMPNCNLISGLKNTGKFQRDKVKVINSFDVVRILLELKETLLKPIPYDLITRTPYYEADMNSDDLVEVDDADLQDNEIVKTDNLDNYIVYFDFETLTKGKHVPYMLCCITEEGKTKTFEGEKCGEYFIHWLKKLKKKKIQLVAHNLKYDFSFIWEYIFCLTPIISGNRLIGGGGRIYMGKEKFIEVVFQDSYNLISCKLSAFGDMFQLDQRKEFMPYSVYTEQNISYKDITLKSVYQAKEFKTQEDKDLFYNNCVEWECICINDNQEYIDIVEYSKRYCQIDCVVLKDGYEKFRGQIKQVCDLDIKNYCTSASLANDFMITQGVYDGCFKISGVVRAFIQKCVYGGKVMTRRNEKFSINTNTADYDCTSEYPSAMAEMEGVLMGSPKLLHKEQLTKEFLDSVDGYFVKVLCNNNSSKNLDFPMLSVVDNNGIRQYTNDTQNKFFYLDKTMVEDAINFIGLDFTYICGYYYDQGRNPQIRETIRHLFNQRLKMKKQKNPIQAVYKLLMNSAYGKSLLKPIDTDANVIANKDLDKYIAKHYNFIKEIVPLNTKVSQVKLIKPINKHYNNCYFGVEVLSMAKRIMSRVMITAEDLKIPMYYTDTDSIHIDYDGVSKLEAEYEKKFNKVLKGKDLGQFHIDFDLKGAESHTIKSVKSIYLGKKCYLDMLEGYDKDGNKITGEHLRMKGIPNNCLHYYANKCYEGSVYDMYNDLLEGQAVEFDLLCEDNAIKFAYQGFDVKSLGYYKTDSDGNKVMCNYEDSPECKSEFSRTIKF